MQDVADGAIDFHTDYYFWLLSYKYGVFLSLLESELGVVEGE